MIISELLAVNSLTQKTLKEPLVQDRNRLGLRQKQIESKIPFLMILYKSLSVEK